MILHINKCFPNYTFRIITLAFIFAHFRHFGIALLTALLLTNWALSFFVLPKNSKVKTIWTAIAAIIAPACFVSSDTIDIYRTSLAFTSEQRIMRFYISNVVNFFVWCLLATVGLNVLSAYDVIPFQEVNLAIATFGHPMLLPIMGWGSFSWVTLAVILTMVETIIEMRVMK